MSEKTWLYGLTSDEWFRLAGIGENSEVAPCCGNISQLREELNWLATSQGEGEDWLPATAVLRAYYTDGDQHGLTNAGSFPLLHRVLDGIRAAHPEMDARIKAEIERDYG